MLKSARGHVDVSHKAVALNIVLVRAEDNVHANRLLAPFRPFGIDLFYHRHGIGCNKLAAGVGE